MKTISQSQQSDLNGILDVFAEIVADKIAAKITENKKEKPYRDDDMLLTPAAAKYIGKSIGTLRNWQKMKKHLPFHINKDTLEITYRFSDLKAYKERFNRISPNG
jgi:hypothetical protein